MFAFHKPKVFRSTNGCCICKAKSSSSRFTDSKKYESVFKDCFDLQEERYGEICNACVLLVKRYSKLPAGSTRNWNHVVDARSGPGIKSLTRARNNRQRQKLRDEASKNSSYKKEEAPSPKKTTPALRKGNRESKRVEQVKPRTDEKSPSVSDFLDMTIWKRQIVCCGTIFRGPFGEVVIDPRFMNPCRTCKKSDSGEKLKKEEVMEEDEEDILSSDGSVDESGSGSDPGSTAKMYDDDEGFFDKPCRGSFPPSSSSQEEAAACNKATNR